jgi:hypothetical protein
VVFSCSGRDWGSTKEVAPIYLAAAIEPSFVWRDGIHPERGAARVRSFAVDGQERAVSAGTSEHFSLPRLFPQLREVNTYLGYLPGPPEVLRVLSLLGSSLRRLPTIRSGLRLLISRLASGSSGGPDSEMRARTRTEVVAITYDEEGSALAEARFAGGNGYEFSARILAWGARQAADGAVGSTGAVGPVEAFGTSSLQVGCEWAGMSQVNTELIGGCR